MPTAYLSASLLKELTDVSVTPGAGNTGYPLVWNNATGRFELAVLGVAGGGTGTSNGSITGTGALTLAAGGTNQNINLTPSGIGSVITSRTVITHTSNDAALLVTGPGAAGTAQFAVYSNQPGEVGFSLWGNDGIRRIMFLGYSFAAFFACEVPINLQGVHVNSSGTAEVLSPSATYVPIEFVARYKNPVNGEYTIAGNSVIFRIQNRFNACLLMYGNGDTHFLSTTESTSTSTGAVRIDGGLGVAKNINIGGNLRFAGGTIPATATSAGTAGDIRYDGSHLYICTATNTWVRTALSTW